MKMFIISTKDDLNGFMNVSLCHKKEIAVRDFNHAMSVCQHDSLFYTHPEDYSLYCLGEFDIESGCITPYPTPEFLVRGQSKLK